MKVEDLKNFGIMDPNIEDIEFYSNDKCIAAVRVGFKFEDKHLDELNDKPELLSNHSEFKDAKDNADLLEFFRGEGLTLNYGLKIENIKDNWKIIVPKNKYIHFMLIKEA